MIFSTNQGRWKRPDHINLGHKEKFTIYSHRLLFQNFDRKNNCAVEVPLNWSDQSHTPSPAPAIKTFKGSQHQGILASMRCNNRVTTLTFDITDGWGSFWCMDVFVWVGGGALFLFVFPVGLVKGLLVWLFSSPREPLGNFHDGSQEAVRRGPFVVFVGGGGGMHFCLSGAEVCVSSTVLGQARCTQYLF